MLFSKAINNYRNRNNKVKSLDFEVTDVSNNKEKKVFNNIDGTLDTEYAMLNNIFKKLVTHSYS